MFVWHEETAAGDELCDVVEDQQDGALKGVGRGQLEQGPESAAGMLAYGSLRPVALPMRALDFKGVEYSCALGTTLRDTT